MMFPVEGWIKSKSKLKKVVFPAPLLPTRPKLCPFGISRFSISTILASFYLYFGWQVYLTIVVGAIYNIGVNSHLVLLGGAYTKTPIDLAMSKGAFGDKKAFNTNTMLLSLPKLVLPLLLYWAGTSLMNPNLGLVFVAIAGVLGFALRGKVFSLIEKIYKTEKYKTIDAYKQKS